MTQARRRRPARSRARGESGPRANRSDGTLQPLAPPALLHSTKDSKTRCRKPDSVPPKSFSVTGSGQGAAGWDANEVPVNRRKPVRFASEHGQYNNELPGSSRKPAKIFFIEDISDRNFPDTHLVRAGANHATGSAPNHAPSRISSIVFSRLRSPPLANGMPLPE